MNTRSQTKNLEYHRFTNAPSKENAVGYCHCATHVGYLSPSLMKAHHCLEKQCPFLERHENKTFWIKRDVLNVVKKMNKNGRRGSISIAGTEYFTDNVDKLVSACLNYIALNGTKPTIQYVA